MQALAAKQTDNGATRSRRSTRRAGSIFSFLLASDAANLVMPKREHDLQEMMKNKLVLSASFN